MCMPLAQLGITVEIIGHELEALESQVRRNLDAMPAQVQALTAFKMAREAHCALVDRLRFLSPLKKTSYRSKLDIHGAEIEDYVRQFFVRILENEHIEFSATETFRAVTIRDLPRASTHLHQLGEQCPILGATGRSSHHPFGLPAGQAHRRGQWSGCRPR